MLHPLPFDADPSHAPERLPDPFALPPHGLAQAAAREVMATLSSGWMAPGVSTDALHRPEGGKMFGVLVARATSGALGYFRAFSGQIRDAWELPGWVPPVFDVPSRTALQARAEASIWALTAQIEGLAGSGEERGLQALVGEVDARRALVAKETSKVARLERRALRLERARVAAPLERFQRRLAAMRRLRTFLSRRMARAIPETYALQGPEGETTDIGRLFAPASPPWATGDCAAPKLLVHAARARMKPLALAEFWWGLPPPGGRRTEGVFYPPCEPKCRPVLTFLLGPSVRIQSPC